MTLPVELFSLEKLDKLYLQNNNITSIPKEICSSPTLSYLEFRMNPIQKIPEEIMKMNNLRNFYIDFTPLDALKFGFIIQDNEKHELYNDYGRSVEASLIDYFEFNKLNIECRLGKYHYFIKDQNNFVFIKIITAGDEKDNFNIGEHHLRLSPKFHISICVFGKNKERLGILTKIRNHIEIWIKEKSLNLNIKKDLRFNRLILRYFFYPVRSQNGQVDLPATTESLSFINYDLLIKTKNAKSYYYVDKEKNRTFPVDDLLSFLGEDNTIPEMVWDGTKHITSIEIINFKIFNSIKLEFSPNINILLGNNGIGKTSILQAITLGLLPTENNDYPDSFKDYVRLKQERSEIIVNWGSNKHRKLYIRPVGKPVDEEPILLPIRLVLAYGVSFNINKESDHTEIVNVLIEGKDELYFAKSIFVDNFQKSHDPLTILKYLDDKIIVPDNLTKDMVKESIINNTDQNELKNFKETTITSVLLNNAILKKLNEYLELLKDKKRQIQIIYSTSDQRYYFEDIQKNHLEIQHLSEGYKDHVLLMTDILVRLLTVRKKFMETEYELIKYNELFRKIEAVILIDEFDRHLHPAWQKKLLSKFKKDFPCIQFFMTTHNPMSIFDRDAKEIIQLESDKEHNIIASRDQIGTKYSDISMIYLKYFVNDIVSTKLQKDIEEYNKLALSGKNEGTKYEKLERKLKDAHAGYPINDLKYWKYLSFLKKHPELDPEVHRENAGEWEFTEEDWNNLLEELK